MPTELNRSMAARVMLDSASVVRSAWYAVFQIAPLQDRVGAWPDKYLLATNRFIKMRARRQKKPAQDEPAILVAKNFLFTVL